jgi:hypothetical protein
MTPETPSEELQPTESDSAADLAESQGHPNLPSPYLHPKVTAGLEAGAVTTILVYVLQLAFPDLEVPGEVGAAITTLIAFVAGFFRSAD